MKSPVLEASAGFVSRTDLLAFAPGIVPRTAVPVAALAVEVKNETALELVVDSQRFELVLFVTETVVAAAELATENSNLEERGCLAHKRGECASDRSEALMFSQLGENATSPAA